MPNPRATNAPGSGASTIADCPVRDVVWDNEYGAAKLPSEFTLVEESSVGVEVLTPVTYSPSCASTTPVTELNPAIVVVRPDKFPVLIVSLKPGREVVAFVAKWYLFKVVTLELRLSAICFTLE